MLPFCLIVVNWFQICIFDISETINLFLFSNHHQLWIGFKFVSLTYQKQYMQKRIRLKSSCELVSNLYLWHIRNNQLLKERFADTVVNWFQICIFDISETMQGCGHWECEWLWIGFKFVSLTYQKQYFIVEADSTSSCELVSNLYLWHIRNN